MRLLFRVAGILAACVAAACGPTATSRIDDAAVAFAIRTALVNDRDVGAAPVDVKIDDGVVVLEGRVASDEERRRVLELARAAAGMHRVHDRLTVATRAAGATDDLPGPGPQPGRLAALAGESPRLLPRRLAVGGVFTVPLMQSEGLDGLPTLAPVFRLGRGSGWRPVLTLTRVRADLPPAAGTDAFGELRLLTLGAGIGYGFAFERWSLSVGGSAGWSFNHIRLEPGPVVPAEVALPVAAANSPALIGGTTLWFEASRRVSVGLTGAYQWTRPKATWLQGDRFFQQTLDADTVMVGVSFAWWLF